VQNQEYKKRKEKLLQNQEYKKRKEKLLQNHKQCKLNTQIGSAQIGCSLLS
jgi:hypothetical protein